jgi:hypothetical protein
MALALNDRVQQTGTANTTVSFTLTGTVVGFQSFAVIGNGNTTFYAATDVSGNWEVGVGTYSTSGPTLTRTTILSSSNSGSAVTFSGTVTVFVTYPSEQSVNLDASGNVSALGTVTSGVWNGSTIPVAYGGTGVTASSGANSVVLRDANANVNFNNFISGFTAVTAAAGTTVLTVASTRTQVLVGSTTQTIQLPDATTLQLGQSFIFVNNSSGALTITNNAGATIDIVPAGGSVQIGATSIATNAGTWGIYSFLPGTYNFSIPFADFGNATISNAVWNGTTIGTAYGGTGLTTFTGANNALYSTGSSTLTAGTLPVPAGGTGVTSATANGIVYGNGTSALQITAAGTTGQVFLGNTGSAPSWGSVPAGSITGTVPIANGGTGQTTAAAAFNALSPITTTGDLIVGNGSNSATRLGIGSTGQVLTVSGGTTVWSTPASGGGTITRTDFTATAGQTVFTVSYTVGLIDVYRNGVKLATTDFTATNGTSFTLAVAANAGDIVQAVVFSNLNLYSTITYQVFNGDGTTTVFTMNSVPANSASLLVAISGVVQDPGTYTVSSTTLTFFTAPPVGTGNISVRYLGIASVGTVGSFSAGTTGLTPSSATTGAVVLAGTLNVANGGTGQTSYTNGQLLIGNTTGNTLTKATLTAGTGITITNGAGSITVANALAPYTASYLIVAGGGGGGGHANADKGGGGGGAGGYLASTLSLTPGTVYSAVVGAGGNGGAAGADGSNGSNSTFTGVTAAVGGGGGARGAGGGPFNGLAGGSGGGATSSGSPGGTPGSGTSGQGNAGGNCTFSDSSSGGGGAGAVGGNNASGQGGNGGAGTASSITGSSVTYAGGGGGGGGTGGTGGSGGGGNAGGSGTAGTAGTANLGGGGGGAGFGGAAASGGNGGSGVVILSVPTANYTGTTTGSPTVTTSGSNTIMTFTASGSYTA